jgi:competence protein ComEA
MLVSDLQRIGVLTVLSLCFFFYGWQHYWSRQPSSITLPIWGEQKQGWLAVEVFLEQEGKGLFFVPQEAKLEELMAKAEFEGIQTQHGNVGIRSLGVISGASLVFNRSGVLTIGEMASARKLALGLPLNLNAITEEDLTLVPGIGTKLAKEIVRLRNVSGAFKNAGELLHVPGIKEKKLQQIWPYLFIHPDQR